MREGVQTRDPARSTDFAANRAIGSVELGVRLIDGVTRRSVVREAGSLRVRFPSPETDALSAVLINTAGGVAGGDRFSVSVAAETDAHITLTTAAAEKIYRSHGPAAELGVHLKAAEGARVAWLPQETILFDRAALDRRIDIELAATASLLCTEIVVFGRSAMGEQLRRGSYLDRWQLRRAGKLVFAETLRLDGEIGEKLRSRATANGGAAIATVLIVPGDEALVARLRGRGEQFGSEWGVSAWNGFALARFCCADAARLRADVATLLNTIDGKILPRIWAN
ncbi:MAG: urease accessory protein UreD [Pseudolabrys sp.]|nr:urease accessory protein UreD [Pseudolabrys sp.]